MRKKIVIMYLGIIILMFAACKKDEEKPVDITYPAITKTHGDLDDSHVETDNCEFHNHSSNSSVEESSVGTESNYDWAYLSDFEGINSDVDTAQVGNLGINLKQYTGRSPLSLVCPNPDNDAFYYVNYGVDDYIYINKDGESSLVLEMRTNHMHLWENEIYFLSGVQGSYVSTVEIKPQSIYRYNLVTKKVELVYDANAIWLYIDSDGIFYIAKEMIDFEGSQTLGLVGYHIPFDSNIPVRTGQVNYAKYKDYILKSTTKGVELQSINGEEEILVVPSSREIYSEISIYNDILYYINRGKLYLLNLMTGEKVIYDVSDYQSLINPGYGFYITGYTEMKDEIYLGTQTSIILRVDKNNHSITEYLVENNTYNYVYIYNQLFTSGERLFAVGWNVYGERLVELEVMDNSITMKELQ